MLLFKHDRGLMCIPLMLRRKHGGAKDIKKSVHFCFHFIAKLPDRMMQPGSELDRQLMCRRRDERARDLCRNWKCISGHSAGTQLVTERRQIGVGIEFGE